MGVPSHLQAFPQFLAHPHPGVGCCPLWPGATKTQSNQRSTVSLHVKLGQALQLPCGMVVNSFQGIISLQIVPPATLNHSYASFWEFSSKTNPDKVSTGNKKLKHIKGVFVCSSLSLFSLLLVALTGMQGLSMCNIKKCGCWTYHRSQEPYTMMERWRFTAFFPMSTALHKK